MRRPTLPIIAFASLAMLAIGAGGCTQSAASTRPVQAISVESTAVLEFGPVYDASDVSDPLVTKTLQGVETTSAAVSAEIRGYLVDWIKHVNADETNIRELVVMKDGSLYDFALMTRPAGALHQEPKDRLSPESAREAEARTAAVTAADEYIRREYPLLSQESPIIFGYLVRIHTSDGSYVDVWVDPDVGGGRFFYDVELTQIGG